MPRIKPLSLFRLLRLCGLFLLCLLCASGLLAQEAAPGEASSDYRLGPDGKIVQRLSWNRVNAYFYEVEIEKQTEGGWTAELKERTEDIAVEVSLTPGMYRYRIHTYNVLGRIAASSVWIGIRVFEAKTPAGKTYNPPSFHVDSGLEEFTLVINGADLVEEAHVYLTAKKGDAKPVLPRSVRYSADEAEIQAVFGAADLALGLYDIVITNPGGLSQIISGFAVDFTQKYDINVSAGYSPFLPLYGYLFERYNSGFYPLGFYGRVNLIPFKRFWGNIGAEAAFSWVTVETKGKTDAGEGYILKGQMIELNLDALYQMWIKRWTMALMFRAGPGFTSVYNAVFEHENSAASGEKGTLLFNINGGVSFYWLVWRDLFVEAGITYVQCFSSQNPAPGFLRASIGAGWKF
jgi:hypothetical protein